jgi:hypothetical protein
MVLIPSIYRSDMLDFFGTAGSGGVYNKTLGQGVGLNWRQGVVPGCLSCFIGFGCPKKSPSLLPYFTGEVSPLRRQMTGGSRSSMALVA